MKITIVSVGKLKEKYLKQGIQEFLKRLSSYAKVEIIEVADEKAPENLSEAEEKQVKDKEGERILQAISPDTYGKSKVAFVIGGSLGISEAVQQRSDFAISFSKMTFPHQLMRLVLLEQVYRGFRINRGEPYHK